MCWALRYRQSDRKPWPLESRGLTGCEKVDMVCNSCTLRHQGRDYLFEGMEEGELREVFEDKELRELSF